MKKMLVRIELIPAGYFCVVGGELWRLSIKIAFLSIKIVILSIKIQFLSIKF